MAAVVTTRIGEFHAAQRFKENPVRGSIVSSRVTILSRDEVFRWIKSSTVILSRGEVSHVIIMRNLLTAMRYRIQPSERIVRLSCRS